MVRRWRGEVHDEAALMLRATDDGLAMTVAASELGGRYAIWDLPALRGGLELLVEGESCMIVKVSGPAYLKRTKATPRRAPRYGALAAPGDYGGPLHALLVIGVEDETVTYFDPWFPSEGQPFAMRRDDLLAMFVGAVVTVSR